MCLGDGLLGEVRRESGGWVSEGAEEREGQGPGCFGGGDEKHSMGGLGVWR